MVRVLRANRQSRIPLVGKPPNRSTATNVASLLGNFALIYGCLTLGFDAHNAWQEWVAFAIGITMFAVFVVATLVHNYRLN